MPVFGKFLAFAAGLDLLPASTLFAQTTTYNQRHHVTGRRGNEQGRIQQGDASGQITKRGSANLEAHQHAIHQQEHSDRAADGGHLTSQDRHQLSREQNRQSARIYRDRHNAATRPGVASKITR
jgi:hypothetical protein